MSEMKKKRSDSFVFHLFLWKEMILSNGLINGVINALLYFLLNKETVSLTKYYFETMIANAVLAVILININPFLIRYKLKKHPEVKNPYTKENHLLYSLYPDNLIVNRLINTILVFIITTVITMGLISCFCLTEITVPVGLVFRGIDCFVFSAVAYYFSFLCINDHFKKDIKKTTADNTDIDIDNK